ncbi:hypothetical protein Enr10x_37520 [Gimesia panareensis]|uniref:Uncharacterized protein n=1 Tax=Gimesia panareensis TaxID=2527978 RepID=A0A517Q9V1_9PLAN|nr:hypothetical protein Enr10x_37520 [Gimesia panareensis]
MHVVEAKRVGGIGTDFGCATQRRSLLIGPVGSAAMSVTGLTIVEDAIMERTRRAGPAGIFPFRFGRQSICFSLAGGQFPAEVLCVIPVREFNGKAVCVFAGHFLFSLTADREPARIISHQRSIFCLGHFKGAKIERSGQFHPMGDFKIITFCFCRWRTHCKFAGRNQRQLHPQAVGDLRLTIQ